MAKDKITDYDSVASNNLDVGGISVAEGMLPSGVTNSIRELMSHQKEAFGSGTPLYVDQTNNRVGVNNAAPATALDVTGTVTASGNVTSKGGQLRINDGTTSLAGGMFTHKEITGAGTSNDTVIFAETGNKIRFATNGSVSDKVVIDTAGNVGIGGTTASTTGFVRSLNLEGSDVALQLRQTTTNTSWEIGNDNTGLFRILSNGSNRLVITGSGSVNIGGTGGQAKFEINNAVSSTGSLTDTTINLATTGVTGRKANIGFGLAGGVGNTNAATIGFDVTNGAGALQGDLFFSTRGSTADSVPTERMRITSAGGVAIGTSSAVTSAMLTIQPADTNRIINTRNFNTTTQFHHVFQNSAGTTVGSIQCNNAATAYNTSSDYRLKTAVTYDWDATSRLKQLKPARFAWIADGDDAIPVDGFLAHEVQDVVPEAISGTKDGMIDEEYEVTPATGDIYTPATDDADEVIHSADVERPEELAEGQQWRETTAAVMGTRSVPDFQGIDQSKLVPLLVKTIQELEARITALEAN